MYLLYAEQLVFSHQFAFLQAFGIFLIIAFAEGFFIIYEAPDKLNSIDLMSCSSPKKSLDQNVINGTIQENLNSTNLMTLINSTSPKLGLEENMKNDTNQDNAKNPFNNHFAAFVITTLWSVGEINHETDQQSRFKYPFHNFLANMFVVTFFFLIVLVFMNFLNGLAVSDVRELKQEAQIRNQILRTDIIYHSDLFFLDPLVRRIMGLLGLKPNKIFLIEEFKQRKLTFSFKTYSKWNSWRKIALKGNSHIKVWMPSSCFNDLKKALLEKKSKTSETNSLEEDMRKTKEDIKNLDDKLNNLDEKMNQILLAIKTSQSPNENQT